MITVFKIFIRGGMVRNLVLVKRDFRPYTDIPTPNENSEYDYPHSDAHLQFCLILGGCKPHNAALHPTKCDIMMSIHTLANF